MLDRCTVGALALAVGLCLAAAGAGAQQVPAAGKYPDWKGQWTRLGGVQWDPSKPRDGQHEPLTPEYQAIYQANLAEGIRPSRACRPACRG